MDSVTDLVGTLARAIGPEFAPYVMPLLQPLGRFLLRAGHIQTKAWRLDVMLTWSALDPPLVQTQQLVYCRSQCQVSNNSGGGEVQVSFVQLLKCLVAAIVVVVVVFAHYALTL